MINGINIYDENGNLIQSEEFGAEGKNVRISINGVDATNVQSVLEELVAVISSINHGTGFTSGVSVDNVGALIVDMGNITAGTDINGMTLTQLLKAAYGNPAT